MNLSYRAHNTIAVLAPMGRIDAQTAPDLENKALALLQKGDRFLVLDLSAVVYMASSGMRVLLQTAKKAKALEARLALAGITASVRELLSMTGFLQYFDEFENVDAAEVAFSQ
jgi:anti-anti-sigma factor